MKNNKNFNEKENPNSKKNINVSEIKGKIEVPDKRERRDGPGGN